MPDAVHRGDVNAIRDGVTALHGAPGVVLRRAVRLLLARMPANRRGVEKHGRAPQRRQPRRLRIPLVPADERPDAPDARVKGPKAEVARSEVELLVIRGIVRDVHLAIEAHHATVGVDDGGAVVIDAGSAALEDGRDHRHLIRFGDAAQGVRGRTGHGLSQVKPGCVLALAEVLRTEKLRQADNPSARTLRLPHARHGLFQVLGGVGPRGHLHQAHGELARRLDHVMRVHKSQGFAKVVPAREVKTTD